MTDGRNTKSIKLHIQDQYFFFNLKMLFLLALDDPGKYNEKFFFHQRKMS